MIIRGDSRSLCYRSSPLLCLLCVATKLFFKNVNTTMLLLGSILPSLSLRLYSHPLDLPDIILPICSFASLPTHCNLEDSNFIFLFALCPQGLEQSLAHNRLSIFVESSKINQPEKKNFSFSAIKYHSSSWWRIGNEQYFISSWILQRSFETGQYSCGSHCMHWKQPLLFWSTRNSSPVLQVCFTVFL